MMSSPSIWMFEQSCYELCKSVINNSKNVNNWHMVISDLIPEKHDMNEETLYCLLVSNLFYNFHILNDKLRENELSEDFYESIEAFKNNYNDLNENYLNCHTKIDLSKYAFGKNSDKIEVNEFIDQMKKEIIHIFNNTNKPFIEKIFVAHNEFKETSPCNSDTYLDKLADHYFIDGVPLPMSTIKSLVLMLKNGDNVWEHIMDGKYLKQASLNTWKNNETISSDDFKSVKSSSPINNHVDHLHQINNKETITQTNTYRKNRPKSKLLLINKKLKR